MQNFTCCVIGRTQLAIDCSKEILRKGIIIQHIFTDDARFQEWGNHLTINVNDTDYFKSLMKEESYFAKFDYLFSIVNDIIIPCGVLSTVRKLSINYHNGPLPRYGGANATHWALLSGETKYGVVWHRMVEKVDSGEVLVRRKVVIDASDNLQSLNWKCWEEARKSFKELCCNLPYYQPSIKQSHSPMYKSTYERPSAFCILPFDRTAQGVLNFFRGTYLLNDAGTVPSTHPNEMGLPKLFLSDLNKMLVVTGINILREALVPNSIPGTVVSVADHLRIATCDHDVMITGLMEMDKYPIQKPFATFLPLRVGTILHIPDAHEEGSVLWKLSRHSLAGKDERKWISQLNHPKLNMKETVPVLLWPYSMNFNSSDKMPSLSSNSKNQILLCTIDNNFLSAFSGSSYQPEVLVLASFLCYLLLLTPTMSGSVDVRLSRVPNNAVCLQSILHFVPMSFKFLQGCNFLEAINHFSKKLSSCIYGEMKSDVRIKTIASDIFLRYSLEPIKNEILVGIIEEGETINESAFDHKRVAILCSKKMNSININLAVSTVFPTGSLQSLKDNFMAFLNSTLIMKGSSSIQQATLCSEGEATVLHDSPTLNGPECDKGFPTWFHRPFEEIASKLPFGIAVMDETGQYTYQDLNQKADDIASVILEKANGIHFDRIALLLDRTWLSLAATIASLKLGVAYIPLETESPTLFNCEIFEDAKPAFLLVDDSEHWVQHWQEYAKCACSVHVITLHDIPHSIRLLQHKEDSSMAKAAVLLYTSGTTGKPKGILVSHKGLSNVINCVVKRMGIQCCDTKDAMTEYSLYDASPTFDTCFLQIFPVIWNGGTVIVVPTDPLKPNRCFQFYSHVTFLSTTPRKLFLYKAENFKCARNVAVGGEDPSMELYKKWEKANRTLWNLYGPAEISVITTMGVIKDKVHMGQAVDNSVLRILSPFQKPVPIGVPGELYILGAGVAQGYTCEKMTEGAFGIDPETRQRWYRSGDLVILNHDGILRYIGRIPSDKQVKIGGKRVEPLGIEYALKSFPGIEYAEVVVERPARNVSLVVAYVAPISVDVDALNSTLRTLFPEHMLPSLIIPVDLGDAELSRTGKLKLDKTQYRHKFAQKFHPASSDLEKELLANYREFLGISDNDILGMHDSFKTFGGDSVIAVSLADRIHHRLQWNIKPLEVLNCTPAEIVAKYSLPSLNGVVVPPPGIQSSTTDLRQDSSNQVVEPDAELSSMQQSLLQMRTTQIGASYNIPIVFEITGGYNALHLATNLESILCNFPNCNRSNASVIPILSEIDLSNCCSNTKVSALQMIQKDACTPLDLKTTVYRCKIYYLSNMHCILSLVVHHIAFDYHSWNALKTIIETGCITSTFYKSKMTWLQFVQSEHEQYKLRKIEVDQFWHDQLHDFPCFIPFPTSFLRPHVCHHRGRRAQQRFEASLYQKFSNLCNALDVQPVCFILSIFALLIYSLSKQHRFCIAVVCSRRVSAELKDTVGFVANTLICAFTSAILNRPFQELLEYTQSWHDKAQKHGCITFSELVKIWGYNESEPEHHFPQFILNCISDFRPHSFQLGDNISTTPVAVDTYTAKAELLLDVTLSELGLSFTWEYDTHLFTDEAIEQCISKEYLTLFYRHFRYFGVKIDNDNLITDGQSSLQLIKDWDVSDRVADKPVVKPQPTLMLSTYQRAILDSITQTPQSYWGYFNCICSFEVHPTITKSNIQLAIEKLVENNVYLNYVVSGSCECLQLKASGLDVCYETATNEGEAEAIRYRELLWPFDIWAGPLFHCTLVHHKQKNTSEVLISASIMLLDEQSLNLFCKLVHDALSTVNATPSLASPHFSACSNHSQFVDNEGFRHVMNSGPSLSIQPLSLMEVIQNYTVTNVTLDIMNFALRNEQIPAISCAIAAVLLRFLKQSDQVQLCFLSDCALMEQHLCSSESLLPLALSVNQDACFSNVVNAAHQELEKNKCPADYWSLQRQFDPYSDYLHPHHEVLVQVVHSNHDFTLRCIRPFQLHLRFCADQKVITLASTLCPQQTSVVFDAFRDIVKSLQRIPSMEVLISDIHVPLPPSILRGPQIEVDEKSLHDVIITAIRSKQGAVSYIAHVDDRVMVMTYGELYGQSKLLSTSLQRILQARQSVNRCVAILVDGGFALPVAVVAAVLSNITFTIIDPNEKITAIADMLKVVKPAIIVYDVHQFNTVKKLLDDKQVSHVYPVLADVFSAEQSCILSSNLQEPTPTNKHAYIVFTSGSTGIPKAAPISEKSFCNFLSWHKTMIPNGRPLNWLQLSSLSFDICIAELLGQLYCGNTLFLSDLRRKLELESYTFRIMSMFNIEGIHVVPTYFSYMLRHLDTSSEHFPSLRHIFSTGEKLTKETCKSSFKIFTQATLHNWAGPSECCVETLHCALTCQECASEIPVGTPANNSTIQIVCPTTLKTLPKLIPGEVVISGTPVFDGYIQQCQLSPLVDILGQIHYRTGDIGYINKKGQVILLHRMDAFTKISGQSVDLEGVRFLIMQLSISGVIDVIVDVTDMELVCFPVVSNVIAENRIQYILASELPRRYVPRVIQCLNQQDVPLLCSGKTNFKALREMAKGKSQDGTSPNIERGHFDDVLHRALVEIVPSCNNLDLTKCSDLTLDALGISSMLKVYLFERLRKYGININVSTLLMNYTLRDIINKMSTMESKGQDLAALDASFKHREDDLVAILNLQVNVPGAQSCDELWDVIINCRDKISHNLIQSSAASDGDGGDKNGVYIGSRGLIKDKNMFDAKFFNIPDIQARVLDPQQRILLHMVWTALEETGYFADKLPEGKRIGCFAGVQFPYYMLNCLRETNSMYDQDYVVWNNLRDNVALLIGRTLNFRGPCVTIANNCATFAVALHYARMSLISEECDIAVVAAGSVAPEDTGYYCVEKDIYSSDGYCRPFSEKATGTVMSDGLTVAILKRLHDAQQDSDEILCIVKGSAVGADGTLSGAKRYAPSAKGQAETLERVFKSSGVDPSSISLVEAHGTGTRTGDLVELESLTAVLNKRESKCILGSIKGNIGHTGVSAAGPSIIKAALALKYARLPPTMNCETPIPELEESKCFEVIAVPIIWPLSSSHKRRALVHSIGAMGTNCAIILEEYESIEGSKSSSLSVPPNPMNRSGCVCYPFCTSAKTSSALGKMWRSIKHYVQQRVLDKEFNSSCLSILRDISYTLIVGRMNLPLRSTAVVCTVDGLLSDKDLCLQSQANNMPICIMFSGQGCDVDSLSLRQFCEDFPCFGNEVHKCYSILSTSYPEHKVEFSNLAEGKSFPQHRSPFLQVYGIVFQVAMYTSLKALGVKASIVLGHSLGEYCAAFAVGVLSLKDMLIIVFERALLVEQVQYEGKMLRIDLSGKTVQQQYIGNGSSLEIACYNSQNHCVVSGPSNEIENLCTYLNEAKVKHQVLMHGKAFHHSNLKQIESRFRKCLETITVKQVETNWVTSISGHCKVNEKGSLVPLEYWTGHLTSPVDFCSACSCLSGDSLLAVEIGMQSSLRALLSYSEHKKKFSCVSAFTLGTSQTSIQQQLCGLWRQGVDVQLQKLLMFSNARRLKLPTYPFEKQSYWISDSSEHRAMNVDSVSHSQSWYKDKSAESVLSVIKTFTGYTDCDSLPEDSVQLVMLQSHIQGAYRVDISCLIREKKKLTEIAEYIYVEAGTGNSTQGVDECCVLLTTHSHSENKVPFFILHAVGGKLYSFKPLANSLSTSFLTYGLYTSAAALRYSTIESCAEFYVCKIQNVQKHGPYYIGGFSFGAWMAHAVSNHLSAAGERVELLVLIDPVPMVAMEASVLEQPPKFIQRVVTYGDLFVLHALQKCSAPAVVETFAKNFGQQYQLLLKYKQSYKPLNSPVLILLAKDGIAIQHDKALIDSVHWRSVSEGKIIIQDIPGTHSTCIVSLNCHNIANAICNFLMFPLEMKAIPVCSEHEIQGVWRLKGIRFSDGTEQSGNINKGQIKINHDNYACITPQIATGVNEKIAVFLNSFGKIEISDQQTNFQIEASVFHPDECPCEVTGSMTINDCSILSIHINDFVIFFSKSC